MAKLIQQLINQLKQFKTQLDSYEELEIKEENFIEDPTKTDDELLSEIEILLKKQVKTKEKIDELIETTKQIDQTLNTIHREMIKKTKGIDMMDQKVCQNIDCLINLTKAIRQRKTSKLIEQYPQRKRMLQGECDDLNEEMDGMRQKFDWPLYHKRRKIEIKETISELCGMEIKVKLFDSNINNWRFKCSDFADEIIGHRHICIVIEDRERNVFGGYCPSYITLKNYHFDQNGFLFSLMRNGISTMKKYPLKEGHYDFYVCGSEDKVLFSFGGFDTETNNKFSDIVVYKNETNLTSICEQFSYDYGNEENALSGGKRFDVYRIIVYEMDETKEMKQEREKKEQDQKMKDKERFDREMKEIQQGLKQLSNKTILSTLFSKEGDYWNETVEKEFLNSISGRKDVIFLIENERNDLFGGYIGNTIKIGSYSKCETSFIFTLKKNGEFKPKRYERKNQNGYSHFISSETSKYLLFCFGLNENKRGEDIIIQKTGRLSGHCIQKNFHYNNEIFTLCGKCNFNVKRLVIFQMK